MYDRDIYPMKILQSLIVVTHSPYIIEKCNYILLTWNDRVAYSNGGMSGIYMYNIKFRLNHKRICYFQYFQTLTLSNPGYFRQLTIRGGGGFNSLPPLPPTISKTIVSFFNISYMCILLGVLSMFLLEFFKN